MVNWSLPSQVLVVIVVVAKLQLLKQLMVGVTIKSQLGAPLDTIKVAVVPLSPEVKVWVLVVIMASMVKSAQRSEVTIIEQSGS